MSNNNIGILGVGAIGSVVGYELAQNSENPLYFFNRSSKSKLGIVRNQTLLEIDIRVSTSSLGFTEHLDWLIICLKEHQFQDARHWFPKLIGPETRVAVIRNGLRLAAPMLEYSSLENVLECMIDCPTQPIDQQTYHNLKTPHFTIPKGNLALEFAGLFNSQANVDFTYTNDFHTEAWKKLCESASLGAILSSEGQTCQIFRQRPELIEQYKKLIHETLAVAQADGAQIEEDFPNHLMEKLKQYPDEKGSSMLTDRQHGKPLELGAKNGIVAKLAKQYGIETPLTNHLVNLLSNIHLTPYTNEH